LRGKGGTEAGKDRTMMNHADVNNAVIAAVRSFGRPYEGPIESAAVNYANDNKYTADFNDLRRSTAQGPVFTCDIDITPSSTHDTVRDYVRTRILQYFEEHPV
jgi:hypothetical protein